MELWVRDVYMLWADDRLDINNQTLFKANKLYPNWKNNREHLIMPKKSNGYNLQESINNLSKNKIGKKKLTTGL